MKQHFFTFIIVVSAFVAGCEGPEGPPGPQGPAGYDGEPGPPAVVIEYENVDFNAPDYALRLVFPEYQPYSTDAILVYAWWGTAESTSGEPMDIWRLLPQTTLHDAGTLVYNYDHTYEDVELWVEANFDIEAANLDESFLEDHVIRLVFVPGGYLSNARTRSSVDYNDYESVKAHFNLPDKPRRIRL